MVLWAAVLRSMVELACLWTYWSPPQRVQAVRAGGEALARWLYYLGVPLWLAWRIGMG